MGHTRRKHNPQLKSRTTRSSKGRLLSLSDPAQTSQRLDDQLRQLGLYAAPTIGDGNCLFRALSDQLYGTDSKHAELRQDICDWIQKHKSRYEPFVEDDRGIDAHLRAMRENATYGGHMELSGFAHMARRNVKVVQPGLVYVIEWEAFEPGDLPDMEHPDPDHTVYVAYHDWEHFSSIRNLKGPHSGLPTVKERTPDGIPPSPITEEYMPVKDRKKADKDRERERKERRRDKARDKSKQLDKGSAKGGEEPDTEPETEPEKLKIKLRLTLNSNPSSATISESEGKPAPQKTGLKLRLPPSRSLSATPSLVSVATSTPPTSHASTISSLSTASLSTLSSLSSAATLPPTKPNSAPPSTSPSTSSASTSHSHPRAHPPTHISAPHLSEEGLERSGLQRTNRSPKRTFDESELEDAHSSSGRVRSRLCGPDREPVDRQSKSQDVNMETESVSTPHRREDSEELEEKEVLQTLERDDDDNANYASDSTCSSVSSSPSLSLGSKTKGKATSATSVSATPSSPSPSPPPAQQQSTTVTTPDSTTTNKPHLSPVSPGRTVAATRRQRREAALAAAGTGKPLTRRQRKTLGLPKPKVGMPYERRRSGAGGKARVGGGGGGGDVAAVAVDSGKEGEEWKRNGTGRVDVRGFRELKI